MRRLSARTRLTLIYASLFSAAGAVLIIVSYSLLSAGLPVPTLASEPSGDQLISPDGGALNAGAPDGGAPDGGAPLALDHEVRVAVNASLSGYREEVLSELLTKSGVAFLVALTLSVVLGWVVSGRVLRPLRDMTVTAQDLTHGDLSLRLPVPEPRDEIRDLAETFNGMLDRIENAFDQERRLVANLSHEIRTPLANQRVAIEVTLANPDASPDELREALLIAADQNRRSQAVSERILHLAQAQGSDDAPDDAVDLSRVVREALDEMVGAGGSPGEGADGIAVALEEVAVRGDPVLLRRMIDNLIENARKYRSDGGRISVGLTAAAGTAILRVDNDGSELAQRDVDDFVRPFHRSRTTRNGPGVGLGLAIVSAVVNRHRGQLELAAREEGGLSVTVRIPSGSPSITPRPR